MRFTQIIAALLREAASDWLEHKSPQQGAALAFYCLLSLAPLLVIAIAIAAAVFGADAAQGQLVQQIDGAVGEQGAKAVQALLENANRPQAGSLATVLGVATLIFGASGVFGQIQEALNTIWRVPPKPGLGIGDWVRNRFLSFAMVVGVGFLLLTSLLLSATIAAAGKYATSITPGAETLLQLANTLASFFVITLLFALTFKVLPDVHIGWRDVWLGSLLTAMLFSLGKLVIGLYLGKSGLASAYGTAGSLVVLIVWVYYSSQILFFGAELTHVYAVRFGSRQGQLKKSRSGTPTPDFKNAKRMAKVQIGDRAPDFTSTAQTGESVSLSEFAGKQAVVLFFYPMNGTRVCTAEACSFRDAYSDFLDAGAAIVGISGDSLDSHRGFANEKKLTYPLISDADGKIREAYGVQPTLGLVPQRATFVIDKQGVVRHVHRGLFQSKEHITESLQAVRDLMKGKLEPAPPPPPTESTV